MRRTTKIVLITLIMLSVISLLVCLYFFVTKDNNIYVKNISLSKSSIEMEVDETFSIANIMKIEPLNYNVQIMCYAENSNHISIIDGVKVKAKKEGETKVTIKALCSKNDYVNRVLNINVVAKPIYPETFSFEKSRVVLETGGSSTNLITSQTIFTAEPIVSYSVNGICNYDYKTGKVTALNIGTTTVSVKFESESETIEHSFEVVVSDKKAKISLVDCQFENNEYVMRVSKGVVSRLYFILLDAEGNETNFEISVSNEPNCEILSRDLGCVKFICNNVGESRLRIYSVADETIFAEVRIIIGE